MEKKTVCIIGLGYIGLPTAALLANNGYHVVGVDINKKVISKINNGKSHIAEANLDKSLKLAISKGKFKALNKPQVSDVYMICVPTPFHIKSKIPKPNIDHVLSAIRSIASFIKSEDLIILESTSPVGTTKKIREILTDFGTNLKGVHIAYCPERVLPGRIMIELVENDRVIGGLTPEATKKAANFYRSFVQGNILETDANTAEMCKLIENSFRDLNIAFANEISMICEKLGINVWDVIKLANRHPRVNILQPSVGVGGHCIAVDPWFIVSQDIKNTKLIRTAREVNDYKTKWVIEKIKYVANEYNLKIGNKPKIACLGLTFKPDIDDLRESRALKVAESLLIEGYKIFAVEPNIHSHRNLSLLNLSDAIEKSDIVCILVKHREFLKTSIKNKLKKCRILDFCGALQ
jgi:UDP-N-acetyl-D-mannosaminuronic acid dehydrogenase